jgi:RNA-directed DNA polymerase
VLLRSRSNTLLSVRQVTQRNAGRKTAGIDGEVALTSQARADVAVRVHATITTWRPPAVTVIMDRCHQARVRNALEPEWEARFEPRSYGFRPGRSCQDAIGAIYTTCKGPRAKRVWALDADLAAALDASSHCSFR